MRTGTSRRLAVQGQDLRWKNSNKGPAAQAVIHLLLLAQSGELGIEERVPSPGGWALLSKGDADTAGLTGGWMNLGARGCAHSLLGWAPELCSLGGLGSGSIH